MECFQYQTANGSERYANIPIWKDKYYYTLYSLQIPGLEDGDIVKVHCQYEALHDNPHAEDPTYPVMNFHAMMCSQEEVLLNGEEDWPGNTNIFMPCYRAGHNLTVVDSLGFESLAGSLKITDIAESTDFWVSLIVYAESRLAQFDSDDVPTDSLKITAGTGGISACVFRG